MTGIQVWCRIVRDRMSCHHLSARWLLMLAAVCLSTGYPQSGEWRQSTVSAADWTRFRGPNGQGSTSEAGLPTTWDQQRNIAWRVSMPGPGASSPIVYGDHIYVTCYSGFFVPGKPGGTQQDLKRHLLCFDRRDGSLIWEKQVPAKLPEEDNIRDHGFAANTPVADEDHVYCFFGKSGVLAFDHQGNSVWQADVGSRTHGWGTSASPILYRDLLIINASVESDSLVALEKATGNERWRAGDIQEAWNTPIVSNNADQKPELVMATRGRIKAFNPDTGDPLWTCETDIGWYMVPSLVADRGVIYCLGGRSGVASLAVRMGGHGDVTKTHRLWTSLKGSNVTSPIVHGDYLYWMSEKLGIAYCARLSTGDLVYEERLSRAGQVYASALLADGRIYYLTREGRTFVVAAKPDFEQIAVNDLNDGSLFNGSFAVDGSRLLVRSDRYLYCIGK